MSPPGSKARATEIAGQLQASPNHEARLVVELVALLMDTSRDALVSASRDNIFQLQGQAQAYRTLHTMLTVPSPVRNTKGE